MKHKLNFKYAYVESLKTILILFSPAQINNHLRENFGSGEQIGDAHALVGAVEIGLEAWHNGPEGDAAFDVVHIGAAAGRFTESVEAGVLLIGIQQRLHEGRIARRVVRGEDFVLHLNAQGGKATVNHIHAVFMRGA